MLVANKGDLRESGRAVVEASEGADLAKKFDLTYFETSALKGKDVDAPFNFLADQFHTKYNEFIARLDSSAMI